MTGVFVAWNPKRKDSPGWIEDGSGCWVWCGTTGRWGYGRAYYKGKYVRVHRIVYERYRGPIPCGVEPDHICRNRACVSPWHQELVTHRENVLRGVGASARNARKTQCPMGHPYDKANTYVPPGTDHRQCRRCNHARPRPPMVRRQATLCR